MGEIALLLARKAAQQRELRDLTWEEKIRMAEAVRDSIIQLRQSAPAKDDSAPAEPSASPPAQLHGKLP